MDSQQQFCFGPAQSFVTLLSDVFEGFEGWAQADLRTLIVWQRKLHRVALETTFPAIFDVRRDVSDDCFDPESCHLCAVQGLFERFIPRWTCKGLGGVARAVQLAKLRKDRDDAVANTWLAEVSISTRLKQLFPSPCLQRTS